MKNFEPHELERAMSTLVEKLRELKKDLTEEEQNAFDEIIKSAALYTEGTKSLKAQGAIYAKPISATATLNMKEQIISLPEKLKAS